MSHLNSQNAPLATQADHSWETGLDLTFNHSDSQRKTLLTDTRRYGPLTLQRPFYPEGAPCHVYILYPPGGIVGGDSLHFNAHLANNSHVLFTMPGAGKFYRSDGRMASLHQRLVLEPGATLEWLPQQTIFFNQARARQRTEIIVSEGCRLFAWDMISLGRPVTREYFESGLIVNQISIQLPDSYGLNDGIRLDESNISNLYGHHYSAACFAYPADEHMLEQARALTADSLIPAGVTLLDKLLVLRVLSPDNLSCEKLFLKLWQALRLQLIGLPPVLPRIWAT